MPNVVDSYHSVQGIKLFAEGSEFVIESKEPEVPVLVLCHALTSRHHSTSLSYH